MLADGEVGLNNKLARLGGGGLTDRCYAEASDFGRIRLRSQIRSNLKISGRRRRRYRRRMTGRRFATYMFSTPQMNGAAFDVN